MAQRRMFAIKIIDSAKFLKMPVSSRLLYYDLGMRADDDGVVEAFNVIRMTGATEDDLKVLASKGYIRVLNEDLVTLITDWTEHNKIRADRKIDSLYKDLILQVAPDIELLEPKERADRKVLNNGTSHGQPMDSIGKDRLGKDRLGKDNKIFLEDSKEMILSKLLFSLIKRNNDKAKQTNLQTWCKYIDYILRIDNREYDDVKAVIEWCQDDDFWQTNILSTQKLRKQYEQLYIKMLKDKGSVNNAGSITKDNGTSQKPKYDFSCFE